MSLFPAYGRGGGGGGGGGGGRRGYPPNRGGYNHGGRGGGGSNFGYDRQGHIPEVISLDGGFAEDGGLPGSQDGFYGGRGGEAGGSGSGGGQYKRGRSPSESRQRKRRRSRSVEEVDNFSDRNWDDTTTNRRGGHGGNEWGGRGGGGGNYRADRPGPSYNNRQPYDNQRNNRGGGGGYAYDRGGGGGGGGNDGNYNNYGYNQGGRGGGRDDRRDNYSSHQQDDRGRRDGRDRGGWQDDRVRREPRDEDRRGGGSGGSNHEYYEQQRLRATQNPKKVFLEEVNLQPEYAFRVDTEGAMRNVASYSLGNMQRSVYHNEGAMVVGATDQELVQIYNKFSKYRTAYPTPVDEDGNEVEDGNTEEEGSEITFRIDKRGSSSVKRKGKGPSREVELEVKTFISLGKNANENSRGRREEQERDRDGFESNSAPRKEGELSMKQKIEKYNVDVREQPKNIKLWMEFIEFQDQVFEESSHLYNYEDGGEGSKDSGKGQGKKKKKHRKALIEKKIAICDKALASNPRNMELHIFRLNLMNEIHKSAHVLQEWTKLVSLHQQIAPFWIEYLRFASTQLQIYTSASLSAVFEKCFTKFKQMLTPSFPEFQRPQKFCLVIADVLFALSLVMKNAGFREKCIALHQAQLEIDFCCPIDSLRDQSLLPFSKEDKRLFEIFWDLGSSKFGEPDAPGWKTVIATKEIPKAQVSVSEIKASEFQDAFFEKAVQDTDTESKSAKRKGQNWLAIESARSKLQWVPWRATCSEIEDVEDTQRIVLSSDLIQFVTPVPFVPYISPFDRQSAYFRHVVNTLVALQEDFLPHSHTIDLVLSAFTSLSLSESRSLFTELFYYKKLLGLYVKEDENYEFKIPEGFRLLDLTSSCTTIPEALSFSGSKKKISLEENYPEVEAKKTELLNENQSIHMTMIRTIIDKAIDELDAPFSTILFEMYVRFEQKNTFMTQETLKSRSKQCKNLMKKDKLRNAIGGYREMALLEYFGGNKTSAIDLLIKTINLGCQTLHVDVTNESNLNLDEDWEAITELTQLFRLLSELYLVDNDSVSYHILTLLGSGFKPVDKNDLSKPEETTVTTNSMLKALRQYERIFNQLLPGVELEDEELTEESPQLKEAINTKWDGDKCVEFLTHKSNLIIEWTRAFALFQYFAKDFEAACKVYSKALSFVRSSKPLDRSGNYDSEVVIRHYIREQLYISWCNLGAHELSKNSMVNAKFRNILGKALEEYPSSPSLLLLFTDVENQMSIAGKLWRMMVGLVKHDTVCNHWAPLFMGIGLAKKIDELERDEEIGLDSFGLGGPAVPPDTIFYKLDSLLEAAQQNTMTRNCPLIWRVHLKLLALRTLQGKDLKRAIGTFYDAISHCPSNKPLYLDGITYFPDLLKETVDLMTEKRLYIRLPFEELQLLLEIEDENVQVAGNQRGDSSVEEDDVETISD